MAIIEAERDEESLLPSESCKIPLENVTTFHMLIGVSDFVLRRGCLSCMILLWSPLLRERFLSRFFTLSPVASPVPIFF